MALARAVLDGEKALFASWAESIAAATPVLLREPVLKRGAVADGEQAHITVNYSPALLEARYTPPELPAAPLLTTGRSTVHLASTMLEDGNSHGALHIALM
jgi:hypothetical protein